MFKAKVYVTLKKSVLDPKGKAVTQTLHNLGFNEVKETRISKFIELTLDTDNKMNAEKQIDKICKKVLVNPNIETYSFQVEKYEEN